MFTAEREEFLMDIVDIAFNGGSNFWLEVQDVNGPTELLHWYANVKDKETSDEYTLILEDISEALNNIADPRQDFDLPNWIVSLVSAANANNDPAPERHADIDGLVADIIIQVAVNGSVDYS